ncbi:heterokaryon incompatibility protein-domain-containing protein [Ilyonectria robusta]|uniref:heterokaryon incompatibility protein-domain-containing protein n=1 Tax=Ilyonectria robusta TaxID=1079257 RepID=UPI001E8DD6C7|nr:heterokaryon incompatibility protein-domain-containing protein [Ilyonectria robusta]KAH8654358.1 heterokaryon incompatibility protein-domain-containing protein [Ilyonectria robusta]
MPCPHRQLRAENNLFSVSEALSIYLTSAQDCADCLIILQAIEELKPGWTADRNNRQATIEVVHIVGNKFDVPATIRLLQNDETLLAFQVFRSSKAEPMYEDVRKPVGKTMLYQTLQVSSHSQSHAAFERASNWLSYCLEHDDGCRAPNPDFRPRRLIDVSSAGSGREPFLVDTVESGPYACLSYCWGPDSGGVLKTTNSNLEAHHRGIPLSLLPTSIQDAVTVCRGLRIQYLWIDSLCIVQDNKHDWLRESTQMRDIYLNSLLTIAAEEPASCRSGFLGEQKFGNTQWQRHLVTDASEEDLFIRPHDPETYLRRSKPSLDKRGWCLQESILPTRRLCFNGDEITWECLGRKICECGHTLWAPDLSSQSAPRKLPFNQPYQDWRALVEQYSDRSLTNKTDKLSAISGLAKMIAEAQRDTRGDISTYRAGLWMREYISDLTWRVVSFATSHDTDPWRAPSWSWASVDGSVRYGFDRVMSTWKYKPIQTMASNVDEVVCNTLMPSDPAGPITAAHAILTGPVAAVELVTLDETSSADWRKRHQQGSFSDSSCDTVSLVRAEDLCSLQVFLDRPRNVDLRTQDFGSDCWVNGRCMCEGCFFHPTRLNDPQILGEEEKRVYCLKLFTWTASGGVDNSGGLKKMPPETWFLLLRRLPTGGEILERIGVGIWESRFDRRKRGKHSKEEECPLFIGCDVATVKIV